MARNVSSRSRNREILVSRSSSRRIRRGRGFFTKAYYVLLAPHSVFYLSLVKSVLSNINVDTTRMFCNTTGALLDLTAVYILGLQDIVNNT